jgi:hypothetical protein
MLHMLHCQKAQFSLDIFYGKSQVNWLNYSFPGAPIRLVGQASRQSWRWVRLLGSVHATPGQLGSSLSKSQKLGGEAFNNLKNRLLKYVKHIYDQIYEV